MTLLKACLSASAALEEFFDFISGRHLFLPAFVLTSERKSQKRKREKRKNNCNNNNKKKEK